MSLCSSLTLATLASSQTVRIDHHTLAFLNASYDSHSKWVRGLLKLGETKGEAKEEVKERMQQVKEGMEDMEDSLTKKIVGSVADEDYVGVVDSTLQAFSSAVFVRLEGASCSFPMDLPREDAELSTLGFKMCQLMVENSPVGQVGMLQIESGEASNLDQGQDKIGEILFFFLASLLFFLLISCSRVAPVLHLSPIREGGSAIPVKNPCAFTMSFVRRLGEGARLLRTDLEVGLRNLKVVAEGRQNLTAMAIMNELTGYVERAGSSIAEEAVSLASKRDKIRVHLGSALEYLDLHWSFVLGECKFIHLGSWFFPFACFLLGEC